MTNPLTKIKRFNMPVLTLALGLCAAQTQAEDEKYYFDIGADTVSEALKTFAIQTDSEILFTTSIVKDKNTQGVQGEFTNQEALQQILLDTELNIEQSDEKIYLIYAATEQVGKAKLQDAAKGVDVIQGGVEKKPIVGRRIEETVVTANKREQSLQDTAMSISALSGDTIDKRGLVGMGDYLSSIPGISVLDQGPGFSTIVIRGLSADPQTEGLVSAPVSGAYFGETAITGFGLAGHNADIKLVDMERVEVLRGPQGTLYGSGSMSGIVRNIPNAPDLEQFEGTLKLGYSGTSGEGGANNSAQGVINLPIIENTLALRAVAYRFDNSGYYRNVAASDPVTAQAAIDFSATAIDRGDIGANEVTGGRISALWQPSDELAVNLSYLTQNIDQNGWGQADLDLAGGFSQKRFAVRSDVTAPDYGEPSQAEKLTDDIEITNLAIDYDLGWATIMSSTSWVDEVSAHDADLSGFFVPDYYPWNKKIDYPASLFSEEIRLVSELDGPIQFLVGFYYEERETSFNYAGFFAGTDPSLSSIFDSTPGEILLIQGAKNSLLTQNAWFGELTYDITEKVRLTAGGRVFDYRREVVDQTFDSPFTPGGGISEFEAEENDVSLKAGIEYSPTDDALLYATWSEGFRLGYPVPAETLPASLCDPDGDGIYDGSNGISTGPRNVDSDFVENFEIGGKFALLDRRLTLNAAVYKVDWDGIPVTSAFDFCAATANAGAAQSSGIEIELSYYLNEQTLVDFSTSYVNAELTEDAINLEAEAGDRLPGSAKYNASLGVEYNFSLGGNDTYIRTDYVYVGGFYNNLQETGREAGDYHKINLKMGMAINQFNLNVYINNLTNDDAITWIHNEGWPFERGNRLQPRTVGLNLGYQF